MKRAIIFFILLFGLSTHVLSQKIQYSRGTFHVDDPDDVQLVSNVGGYHHLLFFSLNKKPSIYIFNAQLQLSGKTEMDFTVGRSSEIRVLSFTGYYLLYAHTAQTSRHQLWKVDGKGSITALTGPFQSVIDSLFRKHTAALQLINQQDTLCILAHTYYDTLKSIGSTVLRLDKDLNPLMVHTVFYPFNGESESLQQTSLVGDDLYMLKTSQDDLGNNALDLMRINMADEALTMTSFKIASYVCSAPRFNYNPADSTILVYSLLREPPFSDRVQRGIFISKLNPDLQEEAPATVLKSQFRQNVFSNFLFVEGKQSVWLNMRNAVRFERPYMGGNSNRDTIGTMMRMNGQPVYTFPGYNGRYSHLDGIRFSILDRQFKIKRDSLVANNKNVIDVQPYPFAQFMLNDKEYLVMIQNFTMKRRGLLMITCNEKGYLSTIDIPVYDRYDYLLSQLRGVKGEYFILPFVTRNEVGLVKITLKEDGQLLIKE
jgi:hypothetical protein